MGNAGDNVLPFIKRNITGISNTKNRNIDHPPSLDLVLDLNCDFASYDTIWSVTLETQLKRHQVEEDIFKIFPQARGDKGIWLPVLSNFKISTFARYRPGDIEQIASKGVTCGYSLKGVLDV